MSQSENPIRPPSKLELPFDSKGKIIGIVRTSGEYDLVGACRALAQGGVPLLEVTLNSPGALRAIERIRRELGDEVWIGAGTILDEHDARRAIDAGSQFIVTPTLQQDSIRTCVSRGVPIVCGAMTPTEILCAHREGATYVKLFPAGSLGLAYVKAVLAPLPFIKIVPTGGVDLNNIGQFLEVCPAVGIGGSLVDEALIARSDWEGLVGRAKAFASAAACSAGAEH